MIIREEVDYEEEVDQLRRRKKNEKERGRRRKLQKEKKTKEKKGSFLSFLSFPCSFRFKLIGKLTQIGLIVVNFNFNLATFSFLVLFFLSSFPSVPSSCSSSCQSLLPFSLDFHSNHRKEDISKKKKIAQSTEPSLSKITQTRKFGVN